MNTGAQLQSMKPPNKHVQLTSFAVKTVSVKLIYRKFVAGNVKKQPLATDASRWTERFI
jgi:hypothetical protein